MVNYGGTEEMMQHAPQLNGASPMSPNRNSIDGQPKKL